MTDKIEKNVLRMTFQSAVHEALDALQHNFQNFADINPSLTFSRTTQGSLVLEIDCEDYAQRLAGTKNAKTPQQIAATIKDEINEELSWFPNVELVSVQGPQ